MKIYLLLTFAFYWILLPSALPQQVDEPAEVTPPASQETVPIPQEIPTEDGVLVFRGLREKVKLPPFFTAQEEAQIRVESDQVVQTIRLTLTILQGVPDGLSLALSNDGVVQNVEGPELASWAIKENSGDDNQRSLVIYPTRSEDEGKLPRVFSVALTMITPIAGLQEEISVTTLGPGDAVGFRCVLEIVADDLVDFSVTNSEGLLPLSEGDLDAKQRRYQTNGAHSLSLRVTPRGAELLPITLVGGQLTGVVAENQESISFELKGEVHVRKEEGAFLEMLSGNAALTGIPTVDGTQLKVRYGEGDEPIYGLMFPSPGVYPLTLAFVAKVSRADETRRVQFVIPSSPLTEITLSGLVEGITFDPTRETYLIHDGERWTGFMPGSGRCDLAWKTTRNDEEAGRFFSTSAKVEARVSAGLLRQETLLNVNVLQGELNALSIKIEGPGDVLDVQGAGVLKWEVQSDEAGARQLDIAFIQPLTERGEWTIRSQTILGALPIRERVLRLIPQDVVHHSGHLRLISEGAVRIDVADAEGLTQLAPSQFPSGFPDPGDRQVIAYRFPSPNYDFELVAEPLLPEISVSQVVVHEMTDTDRVISAAIELDIREASLREWSLGIPEAFAVVSAQGAAVSDYSLGDLDENGRRLLKISFNQAAIGRQLIELRLEQNEPAVEGTWDLSPLSFPQSRSVRGFVGVAAVPGFRVGVESVDELTEIATAQFPSQVKGLQQAFRIRSAEWAAAMNVEALGQTVQADVFHLYSLKQGLAYGSVLVNYFVGGAPVSEWRLQVPEEMGNVSIDGQEVQSWRREGGEVVVTLHQSILGPATLLLTFEQPMSARGGMLSLGQVQPLGVESERGYVQVVSSYQVKTEVNAISEGLLSVEPLELPTEFRLFTSAPTIAVYQYTTRPFQLEINLEWYPAAETTEQAIDFARLASDVSRDGEVVTEGKYYVKSRGRQTIRFRMPKDAKLWEVKVGKDVVNARQDGDIILIPLTGTADPNEVVEVNIRIGHTNPDPRRPQSVALTPLVSTMLVEWEVNGEGGRVLQPVGESGSSLVNPPVTETGYEWLYKHNMLALGALILIMGIGFGVISRATRRWHLVFGTMVLFVGGMVCLGVGVDSLLKLNTSQSSLNFTMSAMAPDQAIVLDLTNETRGFALLSWPGVVAIIVGLGFLLAGLIKSLPWKRWVVSFGWLLVAVGLLAQHGGATLFWVWLGVLLVIRAFDGIRWKRNSISEREIVSRPQAATSSLLPWILGVMWLIGASTEDLKAEGPVVSVLEENWRIEDGRLYGSFALQVSGEKGESLQLLKHPAFLTHFESATTRVARRKVGSEDHDYLILDETGNHHATAEFEMGVPNPLGDFPIPTASAAVHWLSVYVDQTGFDVNSPSAVRSEALNDLPSSASGARLLLRPEKGAVLQLTPRQRDLSLEPQQFFAEVMNLFLPKPGVVDASHRVNIRPSQGEVSEVHFRVSEGFTVSDLKGEAVKAWRFDPEASELRVDLEPPQGGVFTLDVYSQLPTEGASASVTLSGLRAFNAAGEVNTIGIAFGTDTQAETFTATGMSAIDLSEFDAQLLLNSEGAPIAELQRVYRQLEDEGNVIVNVLPVEPDVRATTVQTLSLGVDRLVLAIDAVVTIARSGVFKLSFLLPEGVEVESISGENLSHWSEGVEDERRVVTLHMKERALGDQQFSISLTGPAPGSQSEWSVPQLAIREAGRQTGQLIVSAETGLRVQSVTREQVSEIDARQFTQQPEAALAYRLLQGNWMLTLRIEALDPWVTARVLEEVTLREGLSRTRLAIRYQIENASVDRLRITLPGLTPEEDRSVRAQGEGVQDIVPIEGEDNVWELQFHRRMLGEVPVEVRFQRASGRTSGSEDLSVTRFAGTRQLSHWFAVRAAGRLEIEVPTLAVGWQRADWSNVPPELYDPRDSGAPSLCLKVSEAEAPLRIQVQRNEVADALKLRVREGALTSVFSMNGEVLTRMEMIVEVMENSPLRIDLPKNARLMNVFANGQSISVAREGDGYLLSISPEEDSTAASLSFVYAEPTRSDHLTVGLEGPRLSIPLQNIEWHVYLPVNFRLSDADGDLDLIQESPVFLSETEYVDVLHSRRSAEAEAARELVEQANQWIRDGNQSSAREALQRASRRGSALDPATNEDARVQLHRLQTEQAVVGLNTLRQKLYLDNRAEMLDPNRAALFDKALMSNGIIGGASNYSPEDLDEIQKGNTSEENQALNRIAGRIVNQQLATEPALQAIEFTLPDRGEVLHFSRRIQVDGGKPLRLDLNLADQSSVPVWFITGMILFGGFALSIGSRNQRS